MANLATKTHLIPIQELTPGAVGQIRNDVIDALIAQVSKELSLPEEKLVIRDTRPVLDLQVYRDTGATASAVEEWMFTSTNEATGFVTITGEAAMADQRYVALFGVRDNRLGAGQNITAGPHASTAGLYNGPKTVSLVKLIVGGADKVIWDTSVMEAYSGNLVAFTPSPVIIPQRASFNIQLYVIGAATDQECFIELIGITCEPRGKVISP